MAFFRREGDRKEEFQLSKLRGQHFLSDKNIVQKIMAAAELAPSDIVLEVGPGLGVMTREILPCVGRLTVVELDPLFVRELKKDFGDDPRIEIVEGDILRQRITDLLPSYNLQPKTYKLVSNLPYNISSAFLKKFLIEAPAPERIVVMLQKEVAERITTNDQRLTTKASNLLGLMCSLYAACRSVCRVPAGAFVPPPKVESAVIHLDPYSAQAFADKWGIGREYAEDVLAFAAKFFAQPRKKMSGLLPKVLAERLREALSAIGESPDSRPAALALGQWVELWKKMR